MVEEDVDFRDRKPDFEQFFDLAEDPGEVRNLIGEYEGSDFLDTLREKCARDSETLNHDRGVFREKYVIVRK